MAKQIKINKIRPLFTSIVTTMDVYEETECGAIDAYKKGTIKELQTVIAVGSTVRDIKVGDVVSINPTRFAVRKNPPNSIKNDIEGGNPVLKYEFDIIELQGKPCLLLQDRDINYVVEDYVEEEIKEQMIIVPPKKEILA